MWTKVLIVIVVIVSTFLIYVSTREGHFRYEAKGLINAPVSEVFPYLSDLRLGDTWSPFSKVDPNMKKEFIGESNQVGAKFIFKGNKDAGAGELEIIAIEPLKRVEFNLTMLEPMKAVNKVEYLVSEKDGMTEFTWVMSGDGGFLGKLINIFIDCEKMVTKSFYEGIDNLKATFER